MFKQNKYTLAYFRIINRAKSRPTGDEHHHIIPRSLGGGDEHENLVWLTYREHFLVHRLLPKMCVDDSHIKKMKIAVFLMWNKIGVLNTRTYEKAREAYVKFVRDNNPMFNPDNVEKHLASKRKNKKHNQSAVAKARNEKYWSDPNNRKKLGERNYARSRKDGPKYKVIRGDVIHLVYTFQEVAELTNVSRSTAYKHFKKNVPLESGWEIKSVD